MRKIEYVVSDERLITHVNYDLRSVTLTAGFVLFSESLKRFEFCGIRLLKN